VAGARVARAAEHEPRIRLVGDLEAEGAVLVGDPCQLLGA
jgi:hypothetical protein